MIRNLIIGSQPWRLPGKDFLWLHISHRGLLQLELQRLFPQVGHLEDILLFHLLCNPLVPHLPQDPTMKDGRQCLHGTHQASSHQQQTLHLGDVHFQVWNSVNFTIFLLNLNRNCRFSVAFFSLGPKSAIIYQNQPCPLSSPLFNINFICVFITTVSCSWWHYMNTLFYYLVFQYNS